MFIADFFSPLELKNKISIKMAYYKNKMQSL